MEGIGLKNIKAIESHQWFDFKPITLLTGTNNSGKSSVINAMQLFQQNLSATNLDDLLSSEFILKTNQNKYGSIGSFVNNRSKDQTIEFMRVIDGYSYVIQLEVLEGLQSKGVVKRVEVTCDSTKEEVLIFSVEKPYPDLIASFSVNYNHFLQKFYGKCAKTQSYYDKMKSLQEKINEFNAGSAELKNEIDEAIKNIEDEFGLELMASDSVSIFTISEDSVKIPEPQDKTYRIIHTCFKDSDYDFFHLSDKQSIKQAVFTFKDEQEKGNMNEISRRKSGFSVLHKDYFEEYFLDSSLNGIIDFSGVWENNTAGKEEFEKVVAAHYNLEFEKAIKPFCDDWIALCSCFVWNMSYSSQDEELDPKSFLANKYLESLWDFGVITELLPISEKVNGEAMFLVGNALGSIKAKKLPNSNPSYDRLLESQFIDLVYGKVAPIIRNHFIDDDINFTRRNRVIKHGPKQFINQCVNQILINFNLCFDNLYVSSNRFTAKRLYSFSENSDFTNLLLELEKISDSLDKKKITDFITKWIREFEIADGLILNADKETGYFKAYLSKNKQEIPLMDFGLGTNQLLPVIFALSLSAGHSSKTAVIEEPEANLHPSMQSKLAVLFWDAVQTFKIKVIAETHSEYLIRKLQAMTVDPDINLLSETVQIYYFNHPDRIPEGERQIFPIHIEQNGALSKNFGKGFFDESSNLTVALYHAFQTVKD
jgi:predicted ATPase